MQRSKLFVVAIAVALAACDGRKSPRQAELDFLRESMERLHALEDHSFAVVHFDDRTGRPVLVGSVTDIEIVAQDAREALMTGCARQARSALLVVLDDILRGSADPWPQLERYRNSADACEALLAAEENRWPGSHD